MHLGRKASPPSQPVHGHLECIVTAVLSGHESCFSALLVDQFSMSSPKVDYFCSTLTGFGQRSQGINGNHLQVVGPWSKIFEAEVRNC